MLLTSLYAANRTETVQICCIKTAFHQFLCNLRLKPEKHIHPDCPAKNQDIPGHQQEEGPLFVLIERVKRNIQIQDCKDAKGPDMKIPLFMIMALAGRDGRPFFRREKEMEPDKNRKQDSQGVYTVDR
jgi:hypothetical protein